MYANEFETKKQKLTEIQINCNIYNVYIGVLKLYIRGIYVNIKCL